MLSWWTGSRRQMRRDLTCLIKDAWGAYHKCGDYSTRWMRQFGKEEINSQPTLVIVKKDRLEEFQPCLAYDYWKTYKRRFWTVTTRWQEGNREMNGDMEASTGKRQQEIDTAWSEDKNSAWAPREWKILVGEGGWCGPRHANSRAEEGEFHHILCLFKSLFISTAWFHIYWHPFLKR